MHFIGELGHALTTGHCVGNLLNQISSVQTEDVRSQHLPSGFVEQQLHHAVTLQFCKRFGIGFEVAAYGAQLKTLLPCKLLGIGFR